MKTFMALYFAPLAALKEMGTPSPEKVKEEMEKWTDWAMNTGEALLDMGTPLGKTKRVTESGISDAKNEVTGYSIVEADSHEEAASLFEDHPHIKMLPGAWIDVLPCIPMDDL